MSGQERRKYPRLRANALVRPVGRFTQLRARPVNDLSAGGLRVYSDETYRPGERLELELLLPGSETVELVGQVVWTEPLPEGAPARFDVGIRYLEISDSGLQRIASVLATSEP